MTEKCLTTFADNIVLIADDLHKGEVMLNELAQMIKQIKAQHTMTNLVTIGTMKLENNTIDAVRQYQYLGYDLRIQETTRHKRYKKELV